MSTQARAEASRAIAHHLFLTAAFQSAETLLLYASLCDEVDTAAILTRCLNQGKRVVLPRMNAERTDLTGLLISNPQQDLLPGTWGIQEPAPACKVVRPDEIDLVVVPGRAFDERGNRIGRGRGVYDRYLLQPELDAPIVGIAFACQLCGEGVEHNELDVPVEDLITEARIIACAWNRRQIG